MQFIPIVFSIIGFLIAIVVHEVAHAWMADRLGDPTAKLQGRLTLNPIAHMDPFGTVLIPLFLIFIQSPILFGWAKPVRFDPYNLQNPRKDSAVISLAGPIANLIVAITCSLILRLVLSPFSPLWVVILLLQSIISVNVVLAIFNLIPIHPLDGGKIFVGILPEDQAAEADMFLRRYGNLILIMLIFPFFGGRSPIFMVISPIIDFILNILIPNIPIV